MTGSFFVVFGRPGATPVSRIGITATRKCGSAVTRNRLKRIVREVYRTTDDAGRPPLDMVVNVRPDAASAPYERLRADLASRLDELRRRIGA